MRFLVITMGPGETSQGAALGKYMIKAHHKVTFGLLLEENLHFLKRMSCSKVMFKNGTDVKRHIASEKYDAVVFCNSKMFGVEPDFQNIPPEKKPFCVSLDSNWLFNQAERFPFINWLDRIYLNFPKDVFMYGLVEKGGAYIIPDKIKNIITTVGLIPSYSPLSHRMKTKIRKKLGVLQSEKLIFTYIGSGVTFRDDYFQRFVQIFDRLHSRHKDIKVIYLSGEEPKKPWVVKTGGNVDSQTFYEYLASSDLVFQHQGLGTLEQAISSMVPAVSNVSVMKPGEKIHTHAWEVKPFEKAGLCKMHYYSDDIAEVLKSIEQLLFYEKREEMINFQKGHHIVGEENMLGDILRRLK